MGLSRYKKCRLIILKKQVVWKLSPIQRSLNPAANSACRARHKPEFITIQHANNHFPLLNSSDITRIHFGKRHDQNLPSRHLKYDVCVVDFIYVLHRSKAVVCKNCVGETVFFCFLITGAAHGVPWVGTGID